MSEKEKYQTRRRKLKKNLYRLLKDEAEGIPKAFLWNQYHSKTKEPVAAHYYGVTKMHNLLEMFDDVFCEVRRFYGISTTVRPRSRSLHITTASLRCTICWKCSMTCFVR